MKCSVQLVSQCLGDVGASCVVCLLNIPASDQMLQLRTCKNYWNIFVVSWRRQQLCLWQLRPRPLALKSRTRTRTRSRIWRSLIATFRLEYEDDYEYEFWARALRKFSPSKPKARAQYRKLVLVVVLVLQSFSTPVLTLLSSRKLWETLQKFSQNLAIWTSRRMLLEQTGN